MSHIGKMNYAITCLSNGWNYVNTCLNDVNMNELNDREDVLDAYVMY